MIQNARIEIRLPEQEFQAVKQAASEEGVKLSAWARSAFRAALDGHRSGDTASVPTPRQSGSIEETAPTEHPVSPQVPAPHVYGEEVHTCHADCPCHTGGEPRPDFLPIEGSLSPVVSAAAAIAAQPTEQFSSVPRCKRGHVLNAENLMKRADGQYACRACRKLKRRSVLDSPAMDRQRKLNEAKAGGKGKAKPKARK